MNEITLYHGSSVIIDSPICAFGRDNLDFGKGFYLTERRIQAEEWARRLVKNDELNHPILNIYHFNRDEYSRNGKCKTFDTYSQEWLDFIIASRAGKKPWIEYDLIEGGVANDRVIDTVNLYMAGLIDAPSALRRLSMHQPNNQICLLNQELVDKYLKFAGYEIIGRNK